MLKLRVINNAGTLDEEMVTKVDPCYGDRWIKCTNLDGSITLLNINNVAILDIIILPEEEE